MKLYVRVRVAVIISYATVSLIVIDEYQIICFKAKFAGFFNEALDKFITHGWRSR